MFVFTSLGGTLGGQFRCVARGGNWNNMMCVIYCPCIRQCDWKNKHTYRHYIMDCVKLENFRNSGACDMPSLVRHFLDPSVFKQVKTAHPKFLQAR